MFIKPNQFPEKDKSCPHCGGSGKAKPRSPHEQIEKWPSYEERKIHEKKQQEKRDRYKKDPNRKKIDYKITRNSKDDDDKKGGAGGAKVPRKPKPSPKSPGEYRPIERKTDPDYARKQDRYRVMAR